MIMGTWCTKKLYHGHIVLTRELRPWYLHACMSILWKLRCVFVVYNVSDTILYSTYCRY